MTELFAMEFFRNAFIMSVLLSLLFGVLSFFVVMRKMSFLGAGIAHTAFGGVALGIFFDINPFLTALAFCTATALLIGRLARRSGVSYDAGIGIFFAFSMALGALLIKLKRAYTFDLQGYLFGNILGVSVQDIAVTTAALLVFIPFIAFYLHRILFMTFDEEVASLSGVKTGLIDTVLLIFLAAIIVISMKVVGIILVSALVVLPASFGMAVADDFRRVILSGVLYTLAIMCGGLVLSYYTDTPPGATMVTLGTAAYLVTLGAGRMLQK